LLIVVIKMTEKITIKMSYDVFIQKATFLTQQLLEEMEPLKSALGTMGYFGVESMRQHEELNKMIDKLKKLKKILEDD